MPEFENLPSDWSPFWNGQMSTNPDPVQAYLENMRNSNRQDPMSAGAGSTAQYAPATLMRMFNTLDPELFKDKYASNNLERAMGYYKGEGQFAPGSALASNTDAYTQALPQWADDKARSDASANRTKLALMAAMGGAAGAGSLGLLGDLGGVGAAAGAGEMSGAEALMGLSGSGGAAGLEGLGAGALGGIGETLGGLTEAEMAGLGSTGMTGMGGTAAAAGGLGLGAASALDPAGLAALDSAAVAAEGMVPGLTTGYGAAAAGAGGLLSQLGSKLVDKATDPSSWSKLANAFDPTSLSGIKNIIGLGGPLIGSLGVGQGNTDFMGVANEQARLKQAAADLQTRNNRVTQINPEGQSAWSQDPAGNWTNTVTLNDALQGRKTLQQNNALQMAQAGSKMLPGLMTDIGGSQQKLAPWGGYKPSGNIAANPFDMSKLPSMYYKRPEDENNPY